MIGYAILAAFSVFNFIFSSDPFNLTNNGLIKPFLARFVPYLARIGRPEGARVNEGARAKRRERDGR